MLSVEEAIRFMHSRNQTEVAKVIGVSKQTLNSIINGHRNPTYETLNKLSNYLISLNMIEDSEFIDELKKILPIRIIQSSFINVKLSDYHVRTLFYNEEYKIKVFSKHEKISNVFNENLDEYNVFLSSNDELARLKEHLKVALWQE